MRRIVRTGFRALALLALVLCGCQFLGGAAVGAAGTGAAYEYQHKQALV